MKSGKPFRGQMSDSFRAAVFIILSGGFQDAYTYTCRGEVFANAQTGNIVLLSTALYGREWQTVLKYLVPVLSFLVGTAVAEFIHIKLKCYEKLHWRQIILLLEILLLFSVGFLPAKVEPLANAFVSFVCALQVQTFHKVRGHAYFRVPDKEILKKALTYFGVIFVFGIGAGLGSVLTRTVGYKAIWLCCALLFISFCMMFVPEKDM